MRACRPFVFVLSLVCVAACSKSSPSAPGGATGLVAPTPSSPADAAQISTLRPTFVVNNATGQSGAKVYEFQISDRSDFSAASTPATGFAVFVAASNVPEGTAGTTSYTATVDLQPATRMFWRARVTQGATISDWSPTRTFNSQIVGYSRPGELYDPLFGGTTIGTPVGLTTFVLGKGIQINDERSFVRYQLAQTITNGEMSVEVEGIYGNGPGAKLKIFSMLDGTGDVLASKYLFHVQYRGLDGNPDNSFSYKALFGDEDFKFEPDFGARAASARLLDRNRTYFWKATWSNEFRLVVQEGRGGPTIYTHFTPSQGSTYNPNPHFAYLGSNNRLYSDEETGSWPGAIYRNLWIGTGTRPTTLGNAVN